MKWGVTYSGLLMNFMISTVLFLGLNNVLLLLAMIPIHAVMFLICMWEERFFDLLMVYLRTKGGDGLRALYGASSYIP
jgi:type IV secretion system protein VirB3